MPKEFSGEMNYPMLFDMYGSMLTKKQYDALQMYYNEDLSLGEIAAELGITRQGVMNFINKGESSLLKLENALGFLKRFYDINGEFKSLETLVEGLQADEKLKNEINSKIEDIKLLL